MDFVVARGFEVPFPSVFGDSGFRIEAAPTLLTDSAVFLATSHPPVLSDGATLVFDGHAFDHDLFLHHASARPEAVARLRSRELDDLGGVFCLLAMTDRDGAVEIDVTTDPLGMYPIYLHRGAGGAFVVSNDAHLIAAVLRANGVAPRRTFLPCLFGLAFNGPAGEPFLYEEVSVLPSGHRLSVRDGRLSEEGAPPIGYARDADAYEACIEAACAQMRGAARVLFEERPDAHVALDVTGGADSRAILAVVLSLGLEKRVGVRNIMALPHPDAHVAALLAERYDLAVGESVRAHASGFFESYFEAATIDAHLHGGSRDGITAQNAMAFVGDLISLTGYFGEIAGKWAVSTAKSPRIARMTPVERTEALLARRRRIGQLDFFTDEGVEIVRQGIIAHYEAVMDAGAEPGHVEAESYLASRCRTHFGLSSAHNNRRRFQPDLLGNPWLVRARRSMDPGLAIDNKVVFDIVRRLGGADLAFAPMADRAWERSVVDAADLPAYERMEVVTRKTPFRGRRTERLLRFRVLPHDPHQAATAPLLAVGSPPREVVYPGDRTRNFGAAVVRWALDNGGREAIGDVLDVDGIIRRCDDTDWRPTSVVRAGFFDRLLPGLLWMIGADTPCRIERSVRMADLPLAAEVARGRPPAGDAPSLFPLGSMEDLDVAKMLLRAVGRGTLSSAASGGGGEPSDVRVATLPDGAPILRCSDGTAPAFAGNVSLRLVAGANGAPSCAGFSLVLAGVLHPVGNDAEEGAVARRRFEARQGAGGGAGTGGLARLSVSQARLTAADGRAVVFPGGDLLTDVSAAAELLSMETHALMRINKDVGNMLALLAKRAAGGRGAVWTATGVDPDGLDLVARDGKQACRIVFPAPVRDGPQLQATIIKLITRLRERPEAQDASLADVGQG